MDYEGQICRPPMERGSFMLPVSVGCSYNRCHFCSLFKHLKYRELPVEEIESELKRVKNLGGMPPSVFLGDGNAFGLPVSRLSEILSLIHDYFPDCAAVDMDGTVTSILKKTDGELSMLYRAGVRHICVGIECGLDDVLKRVEKEHDMAEAAEAVKRLSRAGILYDAHIMTGIAGHGRGQENADALAAFFNCTKPSRIINFSLFIDKSTAMYDDIAAGSFVPADELENIKEERRLLAQLETEGLQYDGFHDFVTFRVRGSLPKDRNRMLETLDTAISERRGEGAFAYA